MNRVSIIGATTWGNTLARLIAANGSPVRIWANTQERAAAAGPAKNELIQITTDPRCAAEGSGVAIFAVPAQAVRRTARLFMHLISGPIIFASAAKGLEAGSGKRMTEILAEELHAGPEKLAVISGPNLSREINMGLPAVTIVASHDRQTGKTLVKLLESGNFSVFSSSDIQGVELCGALKNVIALGAGMSDGLGLGSNAKAALVTVGWQEAMKLGRELGASEETFYGFAGLGDLVTTCISPLSRNYHVGYEISHGEHLTSVLKGMQNVAEGVDTAVAVHLLAGKVGVKLPLMDAVYRVLYENMDPRRIAGYFLNGHRPA